MVLSAQEYEELCKKVYALILVDYENIEDLHKAYPQLVVMYLFVKLLRGDAFLNAHAPVWEFQKQMLVMENNLHSKLQVLKDRIVKSSSKALYNNAQYIKEFEL